MGLPSYHFRSPYLNGRFERRRSFEANRLAGLHLNRLAGARVHALARLGLLDREGAETWQREAAVLFQLLHNGLDQIRGGAVCGNAGDLGGVLDNLRNKCLRHVLVESFPMKSVRYLAGKFNEARRDQSNRKENPDEERPGCAAAMVQQAVAQ